MSSSEAHSGIIAPKRTEKALGGTPTASPTPSTTQFSPILERNETAAPSNPQQDALHAFSASFKRFQDVIGKLGTEAQGRTSPSRNHRHHRSTSNNNNNNSTSNTPPMAITTTLSGGGGGGAASGRVHRADNSLLSMLNSPVTSPSQYRFSFLPSRTESPIPSPTAHGAAAATATAAEQRARENSFTGFPHVLVEKPNFLQMANECRDALEMIRNKLMTDGHVHNLPSNSSSLSSTSLSMTLTPPLQMIALFIDQASRLYTIANELHERLGEESSLRSLIPITSAFSYFCSRTGKTLVESVASSREPAAVASFASNRSPAAPHPYSSKMKLRRSPRTLFSQRGVETINQYVVNCIIGYGTTAKVSKCTHAITGKVFAVKSIKQKTQQRLTLVKIDSETVSCDELANTAPPTSLASAGQMVSAATTTASSRTTESDPIEWEIQTLSRIRHPYIVSLEEVIDDREDFQVHLVTPLAAGGPLTVVKDHSKETNSAACQVVRPMSRLARLMQELAEALHYLHSMRLAHNDIKPDNILLTAEDHIMLVDFGVCQTITSGSPILYPPPPPAPARARTSENVVSSHQSASWSSSSAVIDFITGEVHGRPPPPRPPPLWSCQGQMGTPAFAAPEVIEQREVNAETDVWSFGVVLFAVLFGRLPFSSPVASELVALVMRAEPKYPSYEQFRKLGGRNQDHQESEVTTEAEYLEWVQLCAGLLQQDPSKRIPLQSLLQHPFFSFAPAFDPPRWSWQSRRFSRGEDFPQGTSINSNNSSNPIHRLSSQPSPIADRKSSSRAITHSPHSRQSRRSPSSTSSSSLVACSPTREATKIASATISPPPLPSNRAPSRRYRTLTPSAVVAPVEQEEAQ